MKSNRVLAIIVGSSGALVLASSGVLAAIWPHVAGTVMEATHAITYACQAVLADLSRSQILLAIIGFFVMTALTGWLGYTLIRFYRLSRPATLLPITIPVVVLSIAADAGLDPSRVSVVQSGRAFAMTVGVRWPEVVLSTAALRVLSRAQLQAVLEHEAHHVQQREPLRRLLLGVALLWVPFRFLRRNLQESYIAASEIEADARVRNQNVLGSALLQLVTPPIAAAGFSPLDARVERLVNPAYRHSGQLAIRYAAVVVILAGALVGFAPRGVTAVYGTHISMSTEAHLTICREEHERMLQSQVQSCGNISTPQTCTTK
ncbi:MAG: M48 family metalloprotease [Patescibacteria group bacterium]